MLKFYKCFKCYQYSQIIIINNRFNVIPCLLLYHGWINDFVMIAIISILTCNLELITFTFIILTIFPIDQCKTALITKYNIVFFLYMTL